MKPIKSRRWITVSLVVLGFAMPVAAGFYGKSISGRESAKTSLEYPAYEKPKPVLVDVAWFGGPKKAFQSGNLRIYASMKNNTQAPRRFGLSLEGCGLPITWHVNDYTWDEDATAVREPIPPGKKFGAYIFASVPDDRYGNPLICEGRLRAFDPDTGAELAAVPVKIINSAAGPVHEGHVGHADVEPMHDGAMHNH